MVVMPFGLLSGGLRLYPGHESFAPPISTSLQRKEEEEVVLRTVAAYMLLLLFSSNNKKDKIKQLLVNHTTL